MGTEVELNTPITLLSIPIELEAESRTSLDFGLRGRALLLLAIKPCTVHRTAVSVLTELSQFFHCCTDTYVTNSMCRLYTHQNVLHDMPKAAITCLSNMSQETDGNVHGGRCGLNAPIKQLQFKNSFYRFINLIVNQHKSKQLHVKRNWRQESEQYR